MSNLRSILKPFIPKRFLQKYRELRFERTWQTIRKEYGALPVAEAFTRTYRSKLWGTNNGEDFFSGAGSSDRFAAPYNSWVTRFIAGHGIRTVVDLGCGDFRVGRKICEASAIHYVGVDIVPDLVAYNQSKFAAEGREFRCANIIEDDLPDGDLCLIRQVLQHLSNAQIAKVLANCAKYPFLLVTEDVYDKADARPNVDVRHGPDNRLSRRSGVYLDLPPYGLRLEHVLELDCPETNSVLRTSLIRNPSVVLHSSLARNSV
jgi:SAM-dependent methyltransferase